MSMTNDQNGKRAASPDSIALRRAIENSKVKASPPPAVPSGFPQAVACLVSAFDALKTIDGFDSIHDPDNFEGEVAEADWAPNEFAARKIAAAVEFLYGFGLDPAVIPAVDIIQTVAALQNRNAVLEDALKAVVENWTFQFERHGHLAPEWAKKARAVLSAAPAFCTVPPLGWYCTREPGHDGPCAAHPVAVDPQADKTDARAHVALPLKGCAAGRDGDCTHSQCPQLRDNEPRASGRHCPLDAKAETD